MKKLIDFAAISDADAAKPKIVGKYLLGGFLSTNATLNRTLMGNQEWSSAFCDRLEKFPVLYNLLMDFLGVDPVIRQGVAHKPDEATQKAIVNYLKDVPLSRAELHAREAVWQIMKLYEPAIAVPAADPSHKASTDLRSAFAKAARALVVTPAHKMGAAYAARSARRRTQRAHRKQMKEMARQQAQLAPSVAAFAPARNPEKWRNVRRNTLSALKSPWTPLAVGVGVAAVEGVIGGYSHEGVVRVLEGAAYIAIPYAAVRFAQSFAAQPSPGKLIKGAFAAVGIMAAVGGLTELGVRTGYMLPMGNADGWVKNVHAVEYAFTLGTFPHISAPPMIHTGVARAVGVASYYDTTNQAATPYGETPSGTLKLDKNYCVTAVDAKNDNLQILIPADDGGARAGQKVWVHQSREYGSTVLTPDTKSALRCPPLAPATTGALAPRTESVQTAFAAPNEVQARLGAETRTAARLAPNTKAFAR